MPPPDPSKDCLLIQPVPTNRTRLIQDTRRYFGVVMKSLRTGWRALTKKKFPQLFARREDLSTTPDGLLCPNDRTKEDSNMSYGHQFNKHNVGLLDGIFR